MTKTWNNLIYNCFPIYVGKGHFYREKFRPRCSFQLSETKKSSLTAAYLPSVFHVFLVGTSKLIKVLANGCNNYIMLMLLHMPPTLARHVELLHHALYIQLLFTNVIKILLMTQQENSLTSLTGKNLHFYNIINMEKCTRPPCAAYGGRSVIKIAH